MTGQSPTVPTQSAATGADPDCTFAEHRVALTRLAYRLLGTTTDAEDVVQDAYLRWSRTDPATVDSPAAYLTTVVTRLCLDHRRAVGTRRETPLDPWDLDPAGGGPVADPTRRAETAEPVSRAFAIALQRLNPVERAAYLLRRVFDYGYDEIATVQGKTEANCRQLAHRAEVQIRTSRPRFAASAEDARRTTETFLQACTTGDLSGLLDRLAGDATAYMEFGRKFVKASLAMGPLTPLRWAEAPDLVPSAISAAQAGRFTREWVQAWNAHDLPAVLSFFADDFEASSSFLTVHLGGAAPGVLRGKPQVGAYWRRGFAAFPDMRFEFRGLVARGATVAVLFDTASDAARTAGGRLLKAQWLFTFDAAGRVSRVAASYGT